ncbi:BtrH N-terminal domain-containing protein [Anaerosporobacter sp.]
MSRKLIHINHHLSSGCCMWSGIEDVYATKTNQRVPEAFLFGLSSFGETAFIKSGKNNPLMFSVADGRTRKTYNQIKDILGLTYQISEGKTLEYALKSVKQEIDQGKPVILGPLDMYHLPCLKMYHITHIPIHYVLMVGYDDEKGCVLIYDCDRIELLELSIEDLIKAWQIEKNIVGDKNGFIRFNLSDELPSKYELAEVCLRKKAMRQLCKKPDFIGVNAYRKIAKEFPTWRKNYPKDEYKRLLASLTEFFGMVPKLPNQLLGIDAKEDILYQGNYNRLSAILSQLGEEYSRTDWVQAAENFSLCGSKIEDITNCIIRFCLDGEECLAEIPVIFQKIGEKVKQAYQIIVDDREE